LHWYRRTTVAASVSEATLYFGCILRESFINSVSLSPGALLGPYEILSALGAGGMGEIYRARDTKPGR
jgi:hypothetical protein